MTILGCLLPTKKLMIKKKKKLKLRQVYQAFLLSRLSHSLVLASLRVSDSSSRAQDHHSWFVSLFCA
jgi:hypothetical protein